MQAKRRLIAIFLCIGLTNFSYTSQNPDEQDIKAKVSEQIAFVLLRLVDNKIRMEKYNAHELDTKITKVTQEKCDNNLVMALDLKTAKTMAWGQDADGEINISTDDNTYTLPLESIFKDTDEEVIAVCFDCDIEYTDGKSHINIILPIKIEDTKIAFLFNDTTTAACGFFMTNKDFEKLLKVSGELTTKEALASGLISPMTKKSITKDSEAEKAEKVTFLSKVKNSFVYIKNLIITKMIAIKNTVGETYNSVFKKK